MLLMLSFVIIFALAACSSTSEVTAREAVESYADAVTDANIEDVLLFVTDEDLELMTGGMAADEVREILKNNQVSEEVKDEFVSLEGSYSILNEEVISEQLVKFTLELTSIENDETITKQEEITMKKIDGKWYVDIDSFAL